MTSLSCLPADARFQIIVYNKVAEPLLGYPFELLPASTENVARAAAALEKREATGGTHHLPALTLAFELRPAVIYFLTDADDDLTANDLREALKRRPRGTVIHTIELTPINRGRPEMPMQVLARSTGGVYRGLDLDSRP
jgi:hypothetical protein